MSTVSLRHGGIAPRTFAVAVALLGAIAAVQIVAGLYFATRTRETPSAERKALEARLFPNPGPSATPATGPVTLPAVEGVPSTIVQRVETRPQSVPGTLLRVAKDFRARGDTANAIAKLQQATALDPGNAEILAELALTYESMQLLNRSNEVWRRLRSLGAEAGPLYELAELKLRVGVPVTKADATATGPDLEAAPEIPDGSTFGISEAYLKKESDPDAEARLLLRVGVKARPETPIDHTKVKIQVFFYDVVNNDQVVLTDADVSYEWVTPGHDWADTGTEVLDVTYLRRKQIAPPPGTVAPVEVPDSVEKAQRAARKRPNNLEPSPPSDAGPRQFLGYIVRVYYKDQLQAVRADPSRLLNLFPPPYTAPSQ